jgi:hypothetical protein
MGWLLGVHRLGAHRRDGDDRAGQAQQARDQQGNVQAGGRGGVDDLVEAGPPGGRHVGEHRARLAAGDRRS